MTTNGRTGDSEAVPTATWRKSLQVLTIYGSEM